MATKKPTIKKASPKKATKKAKKTKGLVGVEQVAEKLEALAEYVRSLNDPDRHTLVGDMIETVQGRLKDAIHGLDAVGESWSKKLREKMKRK